MGLLSAVLKGGNIVESGSHNELVDRPGGTYATLLKLQMTAQRQQEDEVAEEALDADEPVIFSAAADQATAPVSEKKVCVGVHLRIGDWE